MDNLHQELLRQEPSLAIGRNAGHDRGIRTRLWAGGVKWEVSDAALDTELRDFLSDPDRFFPALEPGLAKGQGATSVATHRRFFVKRYNHRQDRFSKKLKNIVRSSSAMKAFRTGTRLIEAGIPTARPVAVGSRRNGGILVCAYLVTELMEGARSLLEDRSSRLARARKAGGLVAALHNNGFIHGDLNLTNLLFSRENELRLVDLDTTTQPARFSDREAVFELGRFLLNALRIAPVCLLCRAAFLQEYCRSRKLSHWKNWWKEIDRVYQAERRRLDRKERGTLEQPELSENPAICVFMLRQIGDVLLVTPMLAALRRKWPGARITVVVNNATAPILEYNPHIDRCWVSSKGKGIPLKRRITKQIELLRDVAGARFDLTIDCTSGDRAAFLSLLSRAPVRLAYRPNARMTNWKETFAYTKTIPEPNPHIHQVLRHMRLLHCLDEQWEVSDPELHLTGPELDWARSQRADLKGKVVLAHFVANWRQKFWEDKKAAELIGRLRKEGFEVWLTCGPAAKERAHAERILRLCEIRPTRSWIGELTLRQLAALIAVSDLFVGVDTAPMHISAALGVPVVALFGPTSTTIWRPWGPPERAVVLKKECRCNAGEEICRKEEIRECMRAITVDEVYSSARELLG